MYAFFIEEHLTRQSRKSMWNVSLYFLYSVFFPDDVYRRKQSERDYEKKIADGLIVLNEPTPK